MPNSELTPSAFASGRARPLLPDNSPTLVCLACGDTMKHLRTIPKLGVRPQLLVLACPSCKQVETMKDNRSGVTPALLPASAIG